MTTNPIKILVTITLFSITLNVNADRRCTHVDGKQVCIEVGDGKPHGTPIVVGGNGGCGTNSACGSSSMGTQDKLKDKMSHPAQNILKQQINIEKDLSSSPNR